MRRLLSAVGMLLLVGMAGCAPAPEQAEVAAPAEQPMTEAELVGQLLLDWDNAVNSGDSAQTAALYADGGVMMPPDAPAMVGREAIQSHLDTMHAVGKLTVKDSLLGSHKSDDAIGAHGTWTIDIAPAEGDPMQDSGRWIGMWKLQADGSWKIARNIWNSDRLPADATPPPGSGAGEADEIPEPAMAVCAADPASLDTAFASTFEAGDLGANVSTHTDDGVRHAPHMESVAGHAALTAFMGAYLDAFDPRELTFNDVEVFQADDWGATGGQYNLNVTLRDGSGVVERGGSYMGISTRGDDGCWRSQWVLWNAYAPPA
jgi:ketosteroid isomerase-like protein